MDTILTEMAARLDKLERQPTAAEWRPAGRVEMSPALEMIAPPRVFVLPEGKRLVLDAVSMYEASGKHGIQFWSNGQKLLEWVARGSEQEASQLRDAVMVSLDRVMGTAKTEI